MTADVIANREEALAALAAADKLATRLTLELGDRKVKLTNLGQVVWPSLGLTRRDLLHYYTDVAPHLLPHLRDRPMLIKRYPKGAAGEYVLTKRAPALRPDWLRTCPVTNVSGSVIHFPVIDDLASLLWLVNFGCIDMHPWQTHCDDVQRPDWLLFDLDPVAPARFTEVRHTAMALREVLVALGMQPFVKTSGSKGMHVCVPIERGPLQRDVWTFARSIALRLQKQHPDLITAETNVSRRPEGRVFLDYEENAWGRALASVYSPRPTAAATVSTPVTWDEVDCGIAMGDFDMRVVTGRLSTHGDLWAQVLAAGKRFDLGPSAATATAEAAG
jgi:bifunctional non-homologous end joining protein LigD